MKKEHSIELHNKVQYYAKQGLKKTEISQKLSVSRKFVTKWYNNTTINEDKRGWKKGNKRKYTNNDELIVIEKRKELENNFFLDDKQFKMK